MTGTPSSTMPIGLLRVLRNAETTLSRLSARVFFWPLPLADDLAQRLGLGLEVEGLQALLDRCGAHAALEVQAEPVPHLAVEHLVALEVLDLEVVEAAQHLVEPGDLARRALADLAHLALGAFVHLALRVALGALGLERGEVVLELLRPGCRRRRSGGLRSLLLDVDLGLERGRSR